MDRVLFIGRPGMPVPGVRRPEGLFRFREKRWGTGLSTTIASPGANLEELVPAEVFRDEFTGESDGTSAKESSGINAGGDGVPPIR